MLFAGGRIDRQAAALVLRQGWKLGLYKSKVSRPSAVMHTITRKLSPDRALVTEPERLTTTDDSI